MLSIFFSFSFLPTISFASFDPGNLHPLPCCETNLTPAVFFGHLGDPGKQVGGDRAAGQAQAKKSSSFCMMMPPDF
jgi:hypothetical protein